MLGQRKTGGVEQYVTGYAASPGCFEFQFSNFEFISDFVLRISCFGILTFLLQAAALKAGDAPEAAVALSTAGGSRLAGMLDVSRPLMLRGETGAMAPLELAKVKRITFGERVDLNLENEARLALGDLQSDQFATREKALLKLRSLGRAALGPLRRAVLSSDAEESNRASTLIAEMNAGNSADSALDHVLFSDGSTIIGTLSNLELTVRSRWGRLTVPLPAIEALDFLAPADVRVDQFVPATAEAVAIQQTAAPSLGHAAERWVPKIEQGNNPAQVIAGGGIDALLGVRALTMQRVPDPQAPPQKRGATIDAKAGDKLDDAYAAWGALLRASASKKGVEASETQVFSASGGLSACASDSDLEVKFILPGSYAPKSGDFREGGVSAVGAIIKAEAAGTIGIAAYDRSGRLLAQVLNQSDSNLQPGGMRMDEFLGVRSKVPIVRARFFRAGDPPNRPANVVIDDLIFDRIISVDRPSDRACVWLSSGERIAGELEKPLAPAAKEDEAPLWVRPEFSDPKKAPVAITPSEIDRYEPPLFQDPDKPLRLTGAPHSVLLQNGESFRARLYKMNEQTVVFILPGGVELALPRSVLRKVDLIPPRPEPGETIQPMTVGPDEKPGVELKSKDEPKPKEGENKDTPKENDAKDPKEPKDPKEKPAENNPAPGISHMENAEVVEVDPEQGLVTIRDEDGDLPVGIAMIKSFVVAQDPNVAKAAPKFRDWILTLREGSRFEIFLLAITPEFVKAEMAGGIVALPSAVIESVQRRKQK